MAAVVTIGLTPTPPIQVPLTNGVVWSFAHITMKLAGFEFSGGFTSIKRTRKRNREMVYANSPDPEGKTLGQNEYSCTVDMYLAWWYAVINYINSSLGPGYGDQAFQLNVSYNNNGFQSFTDQILGCTFDSTEANDEKGIAPLVRGVELNPVKIKFAGLDDVADPLNAYTSQGF